MYTYIANLLFDIFEVQGHTVLKLCTHDSGIRLQLLSVYFLQFDVARRKAELQDKLTSLKYMLSEASLQLLPEYKQRIQVRSVSLLLYEPPSFLKQEYSPFYKLAVLHSVFFFFRAFRGGNFLPYVLNSPPNTNKFCLFFECFSHFLSP